MTSTRTLGPPCPKTRALPGVRDTAGTAPRPAMQPAVRDGSGTPRSVTVTIPLDTPEARENAAMAFGYPDWQSLLDAAQAGEP